MATTWTKTESNTTEWENDINDVSVYYDDDDDIYDNDDDTYDSEGWTTWTKTYVT